MRRAYKVSRSAEAVFNYIVKYKLENNDRSPSVREIMRGCDFRSTCVAHYHLRRLESAGLIERDAKKSRSIRVIREASSCSSGKEANA